MQRIKHSIDHTLSIELPGPRSNDTNKKHVRVTTPLLKWLRYIDWGSMDHARDHGPWTMVHAPQTSGVWAFWDGTSRTPDAVLMCFVANTLQQLTKRLFRGDLGDWSPPTPPSPKASFCSLSAFDIYGGTLATGHSPPSPPPPFPVLENRE